MPTTPTLLLPYPATSDPADVPLDMQELADRIEAVRGAANGLASLDSSGKVPAAQIPAAAAAPGTEVAYAQITAPVTISATTEASANTIVTAPAFTFPGSTAYNVEFFAPQVGLGNAAGSLVIITLWDGSTDLGRWGYFLNNSGTGGAGYPVLLRRKITPAAGSRTFSVRAMAGGANGSVNAGAGGTSTFQPAYVRITAA